MKKIINELSSKKLIFAVSVLIAYLVFVILGDYFYEMKYGPAIPGLISGEFDFQGFSAVLESFGRNYPKLFFKSIFTVFLPYLVIAIYFFKCQNEPHPGWKRIYQSIQISTPILFALIAIAKTKQWSFVDYLSDFIFYFGLSAAVVLILVERAMWIRQGFAVNKE